MVGAAPDLADVIVLGPPRRRVLHVFPDLAIGGGQTIVWSGVHHANRKRYDITACHLLPDREMASAFESCEVPVIDLHHRTGLGLLTIARLVRVIRRHRIDVVHVHSDLDRKYAHVAAWVTNVPVVGHLHAEWNHMVPGLPANPTAIRRRRASMMAAVRRCFERATVVHYIAESGRVRDLFEPLVGDTPITVLDQSIALDRFEAAAESGRRGAIRSELGLAPSAPVLVNVSRMVDGKGQDQLLRALASVREAVPAVRLLLVGDGPRRPSLEQLAHDLGIDGAVVFAGSRTDIADVLAAGDIFVFASESEGFGMAVLEAMAAALPVVAFGLPAFDEFAEDGVTADLVPLGDLRSLEDAVIALLGDPDRRAAMGLAGYSVVRARFGADAVAKSFECVYGDVLDDESEQERRRTA